MNSQHLRAFIWLRWRLRINQMKRGGIANFVILTILAIAAGVAAVGFFVGFFTFGLFALNDASPDGLMYLFDGAVIAFLFLWTTGLLSELQRSEVLSLDKFLHLPVSLTSAFLINYLSSLPSVSLLWFLSAMLGLNLGLIFSRGLAMLWLLPMLAAFVLMVTALTYQFQGWLATMMTNPRRRRTIIAGATIIVILLTQVPNLVNIFRPWHPRPRPAPPPSLSQEEKAILNDINTGKTPLKELPRRLAELKRQEERYREEEEHRAKENEEQWHPTQDTIRLLNLLLPPGWLPAGVEAAVEGRPFPIVLAILGPALIGMASLWRAYRTTLRLYTGQYTFGQTAILPSLNASEGGEQPSLTRRERKTVQRSRGLLEKSLPWLSEQVTVIALAGFRSL